MCRLDVSFNGDNQEALPAIIEFVQSVNSKELFVKDDCIWMRCPSGNDKDITLDQIEAAAAFYARKDLPFTVEVEPGACSFYEIDKPKYGGEETTYTGEFAVWDYNHGELQRHTGEI